MNLKVIVRAANDPAEVQFHVVEVIAPFERDGQLVEGIRARGVLQLPTSVAVALATVVDQAAVLLPTLFTVQWEGARLDRVKLPGGMERAVKFAMGVFGGLK